jgi:hypothetical protein
MPPFERRLDKIQMKGWIKSRETRRKTKKDLIHNTVTQERNFESRSTQWWEAFVNPLFDIGSFFSYRLISES